MADPRSRRGREMRGPLLPPTVPGWRSRAERFDMAVLEAYEPIERRWQDRVSALDVAVDEIPRIAPKDPDSVQWPPEVVADGPIALARLIPAGVDVRGNATRARIVLFRKPIERRAKDTDELAELAARSTGGSGGHLLGRRAVRHRPDDRRRMSRRSVEGSDDAALEAATLPLGEAAPDAEALVVGQRVVEARVLDLAAQADALGLAGGAALLGEERLGVGLRAQRAFLPLVVVDQPVA